MMPWRRIAIPVLAVLLAWPGQVAAEDGYGKVQVKGPRRVRIFIDGRFVGVTARGGLLVDRVRAGERVLKAERSLFAPLEARITVKAGETLVHELGSFHLPGQAPKPKPEPKPTPPPTEPSPPAEPEWKPSAPEPTPGKPLSAKQMIDVLSAPETPAFISAVAEGSDWAKATAAALAKDPEAVRTVTAALLAEQAGLAGRDGDTAITMANWVVEVATAAKKTAPKLLASKVAMWQANLARARIGLARHETAVQARYWTTAADYILEAAAVRKSKASKKTGPPFALSVLEEAGKADDAPLLALADHAARVCQRIITAGISSSPLRRAVAASYKWQGEVFEARDRKRMQAAFRGYFDVFAPLSTKKRARKADKHTWNKMISVARIAKLDINRDYLSKSRKAASNLLAYALPITPHWSGTGSEFEQDFERRRCSRRVVVRSYSWTRVYGAHGSVRDVGGDNVKGLAGRSMDRLLESLAEGDNPRKVRKTRKPKRTRLNDRLPAGIEYVVEYEGAKGPERRRAFFVKAVKAQMTLEIAIYETGDLPDDDPEWQSVIASFDITKKTR